MEERLVIQEILKTNLAVSADKAQYISKLLQEKIDEETPVILDFSGIRSLTTAFLNIAVGQIYGKLDKVKYDKYVKVDRNSMSALQFNKYNLVLDNSKAKRSKDYSNKISEVILHGYSDWCKIL